VLAMNWTDWFIVLLATICAVAMIVLLALTT
jgi:hypothetical protein